MKIHPNHAGIAWLWAGTIAAVSLVVLIVSFLTWTGPIERIQIRTQAVGRQPDERPLPGVHWTRSGIPRIGTSSTGLITPRLPVLPPVELSAYVPEAIVQPEPAASDSSAGLEEKNVIVRKPAEPSYIAGGYRGFVDPELPKGLRFLHNPRRGLAERPRSAQDVLREQLEIQRERKTERTQLSQPQGRPRSQLGIKKIYQNDPETGERVPVRVTRENDPARRK